MATIRRVRRVRSAPVDAGSEEIDSLMKSIANAEDAITALSAKVKKETQRLYELLVVAKETTHQCGELVAGVVIPAGRSSTVIDARKFYNEVDEDDFFDSVTVSVTKAKQVLSERMLAKISKVTPGTPGEPTVKIKRIKVRG